MNVLAVNELWQFEGNFFISVSMGFFQDTFAKIAYLFTANSYGTNKPWKVTNKKKLAHYWNCDFREENKALTKSWWCERILKLTVTETFAPSHLNFSPKFPTNSPVLSSASWRCPSWTPRWSRSERGEPEILEVSRRTLPAVSRQRPIGPPPPLRLVARRLWCSGPDCCCSGWCCCYYCCYCCCSQRRGTWDAARPWWWSWSLWWSVRHPRDLVPSNALAPCRISQLKGVH